MRFVSQTPRPSSGIFLKISKLAGIRRLDNSLTPSMNKPSTPKAAA